MTTFKEGDFFEMAGGRVFFFRGAMGDETAMVLICSVADRVMEVTANACLVKVRESAELYAAPRVVSLCGAWTDSASRPGCTYMCAACVQSDWPSNGRYINKSSTVKKKR